MIRVSSTEEQLKIQSILSSSGNDLIVALNLASNTPEWLQKIGAKPMKLGLDLRGGVHFLMEVDSETAIKNRQNGTVEDIKRKLRDEKIRYSSIFVNTDNSINLSTLSLDELNSASELVEDYPQFSILPSEKELSLRLILTQEEMDQIQADAIDQNLTTLRNRVNELGVSEPIVQRQGKKPMNIGEFLKGFKFSIGHKLNA